MRVLWIIDNKFRELYGLYDLKKKLKKHNIKLLFFSIPVWKSAIDFIEDIAQVSDGLMIARGDLGIECRIEKVGVHVPDALRRHER